MKKINRKGFTLIELLAVIVVLAIVMVLAVPIVLGQMNNAKKKSFQIYGERMSSAVMQAYESDKMLGDNSSKKFSGTVKNGDTEKTVTDLPCYDLSDLKLETTGNYKGFVVVEYTPAATAEGSSTTYYIFLSDETYAYDGKTSQVIYNNPNAIVTGDGVNAINTIVGIGAGASSSCHS